MHEALQSMKKLLIQYNFIYDNIAIYISHLAETDICNYFYACKIFK